MNAPKKLWQNGWRNRRAGRTFRLLRIQKNGAIGHHPGAIEIRRWLILIDFPLRLFQHVAQWTAQTDREKLIEVTLLLEAISKESARQNSIVV